MFDCSILVEGEDLLGSSDGGDGGRQEPSLIHHQVDYNNKEPSDATTEICLL